MTPPRCYADELRAMGLAVSEHGARCAELAGRFYGGLHHFPGEARGLRKVDWNHWLFCAWKQRAGLQTYDFDSLTHLVFLAHDLGIRVEVNPAMSCLEIMCHPRALVPEVGRATPHPTIESALAYWRLGNPARTP